MGFMNVYCVPVVRRRVRVTGGILTVISVQPRCCRLTGGLLIAAMRRRAIVLMILRIRSGFTVAIRL